MENELQSRNQHGSTDICRFPCLFVSKRNTGSTCKRRHLSEIWMLNLSWVVEARSHIPFVCLILCTNTFGAVSGDLNGAVPLKSKPRRQAKQVTPSHQMLKSYALTEGHIFGTSFWVIQLCFKYVQISCQNNNKTEHFACVLSQKFKIADWWFWIWLYILFCLFLK